MSITAVNLLYSGISSNSTPTKQSYTETYQVLLDAPTDDPALIENHPLIPIFGSFFPGNPLALCNAKTATPDPDTRLKWFVTVTYETLDKDDKDQTDNNGNPSENPEDWRDKVEWLSGKYTAALDRAILLSDAFVIRDTGLMGPVVNTVNDPFDPPAEFEKNRAILRITKTQYLFPNVVAAVYDNTINADTFTIRKPGLLVTFEPFTAKLEPITGALEYYDRKDGISIPYWRVVYELSILSENWHVRILNRGFNRKVDEGDKDDNGRTMSASDFIPANQFVKVRKASIKDMDNLEVRTPVLLDIHGQPLPKGEEPIYIEYQGYDALNFGKLKL